MEGNPEISAHVKCNLLYLIYLRHLIASGSGHKSDFFCSPKKPILLHACATCSELPSTDIRAMTPTMSEQKLQGAVSNVLYLKYCVQS